MPPLNGMDSAASALRYWERKQEVVANNLANVSTTGFKSQHVFAQLMNGTDPVAATTPDLSTGNLQQTGNATDVAIDGQGFFVVNTPNGERWTRGGSLRLDDKHQLVDADGRPLLGEKGAALKLLDGPVEITRTGEVRQSGQIVDRLRMETAAKGSDIQREGESLWIPPQDKAVMKPDARNVKQGYIEESNVNSMSALVDMVAVQRAYASVEKAIVTMDSADETITTQIAKPL